MRITRDGEGTSFITVRVNPQRLVLLQGIFELYENVAIIRTVERDQAEVSIVTSDDFLPDCEEILLSIRDLVGLIDSQRE